MHEDARKCALSQKAQSAFGTMTSVTGNSYELCQPRQLGVTIFIYYIIFIFYVP